jgi:hypothetical protein
MSLTDEGREKTAEDVAGDKQKRLIEEVQKATDIMSTDPSDVDFDEGW